MDWTETGENIGKQDIDKESIVYYKQVHCKKCNITYSSKVKPFMERTERILEATKMAFCRRAARKSRKNQMAIRHSCRWYGTDRDVKRFSPKRS